MQNGILYGTALWVLGQGGEEPHKDFSFYLNESFIKTIEKQVDEQRQLDKSMFLLPCTSLEPTQSTFGRVQ
jgi:hypothetical protein